MIKKFVQFFSVIAIFILIAGCQKMIIAEDQNSITTNTTDSLYLTRSFGFETVGLSNQLDTFSRAIYIYDNLKRLVKLVDTIGNSSAGSNLSVITYQYFYTGNDTLAYKLSENNSGMLSSTFYFYNLNGWLIKDSSGNEVSNYTYTNNFIYGTKTISIAGFTFSTKDTSVLDVRGNVVETRSRTYYPVGSGFGDSYTKTVNSYDNFKCPSASRMFYPVLSGSKKNNLVKYVMTTLDLMTNITNIESEDYSNGMTYNTNGYPTVSRDTTPIFLPGNPNNPLPYEHKFLYFYTAL